MLLSPLHVSIGIAVVLLFPLTYFLYRAAQYGHSLARMRGSPDTVTLEIAHRTYTSQALFVAILLLVLIEMVVHFFSTKHPDPWLFHFHLFFAISFLATFLAIKFRFTGIRSRIYHGILAYTCFTCGALALPSGLWMFWEIW